MKFIISLFFFVGCTLVSNAQRTCDTDGYLKANPFVHKADLLTGPSRDTVANEVITIPVVVHVLFKTAGQNIPDEQILSQIAVLNKDYRLSNADAINIPLAFRSLAADTRINFCLARVDPYGNSTSGIVRRYTSVDFFMGDDAMKYTASGGDNSWDSKKYLNIWVCNLFGRSLGYATMPGAPADKDGVVIKFDVFGGSGALRYPFNKGRTATHEIAHWLGLKHIWGDDDCGSDEVEDTPRQQGYNFNCPSFPHTTSCSLNPNGDMFMNFMDFTNDACMNMFTIGQKNRIRSGFALNGSRNSFLISYACDSSLASGGPLPNDTLPVAQPADEVRIYPNPFSSYIEIRSKESNTLTGKIASLSTADGRLIKQQLLQSNTERMTVGQLPPGIYILRINKEDRQHSIKLVKIP